MTDYVTFLLLGLANGAVFAALGLALTVTFRSSGVMNFATSSLALFTATIYAGLRSGEFIILIPGLPGSIGVGGDWPFWPSALVALGVSALLGLVLYLVVFRSLRTASATSKAVASLGVMVVITGVTVARRGTVPPSVPGIFPATKFDVGGISVGQDRVWLAATVVVIALAMWALTRFTRFGLQTRANAESERGALLSGLSPDRIAAANWMISAVVCGIAGVLIAPVVPLVPIQYTLFIVPALATALIGGFERIGAVVAGGLVIGMLQSEALFLQARYSWMPRSGTSELVPLIVILVVLVIRSRPLPSRGVELSQVFASAPRPHNVWRVAAAAIVVGVVGLVVLSGPLRAALVTSMIFAIICCSFVVVTGFTGQISLAQLTLAGVAGFILGPLTTGWRVPLIHTTIPFPVAPIVAALGATVVGIVIGLPAVRVRGLQLAVVTLAAAVAIEALWFRNSSFVSSSGFAVEGPEVFGVDLSAGVGTSAYPRMTFCLFALGILAVVGLGVARLRTSRLGASMLAVRANERAAAAAGIDVARTKLVAFALGAFIAGLGGSLLAYKQGNVTFDTFQVFLGLGLFATACMAGFTSVTGAVVAGLISASGLLFKVMDDSVDLGPWFSSITGVGLIIVVIHLPEGIAGGVHDLWERLRRRADDREAVTASLTLATQEGLTAPAVSERGVAERPVVLSLREVSVRYRGLVAVFEVGFDVPEASIVGLIGPNGAGKTTLLDAISGFTPARGHFTLDDVDLEGLAPHRRARLGLGRTFQSLDLYDDLDVTENLMVGLGSGLDQHEQEARVLETLDVLGIRALAHASVNELSQGTRQLVSIGRAFVARPKLLLLDEPAAGLDAVESRWLGARLRAIADHGTAILLVDHDMQLVLDFCDEIRVLDFGELIASGAPSEIRRDPRVVAAYLGHGAAGTSAAHHAGRVERGVGLGPAPSVGGAVG